VKLQKNVYSYTFKKNLLQFQDLNSEGPVAYCTLLQPVWIAPPHQSQQTTCLLFNFRRHCSDICQLPCLQRHCLLYLLLGSTEEESNSE